MKSLFISMEGIDGSGKTSSIKMLSDWMKERGLPFVLTKEPGTQHVQECAKIRKLLLDPRSNICDMAELFLFLADRASHVEKFIKKSLSEGKHVICDRYSDSTRVYQCARGFSRDKVDMLIELATGGLEPDLTFILDVPVEVGLSRAKAKSIYKDGDRMEQAGEKFYDDVRHGFLKLGEGIKDHDRIVIIDAAPPKNVDEVFKEIVEHVSKKLWLKETE